jgi:uncharacterized protein YwqG
VREVNEAIRGEPEPEHEYEDEPWYTDSPVKARPSVRTVTIDQLLDRCEGVGLAARREEVRELACTSLRLTRAEPRSRASGRSRLGSAPDLPTGFDWPVWRGQELAFLGQLDLAEVAALYPETPLPGRGLLLFFYDVAGHPSGLEPAHQGSWRVVHADGDPSHLERAGADRATFADYPLQLSLELMLPRTWTPLAEALALDGEETPAWDELREQLARAQGVELEELAPKWQSLHRLLGYPEELGGGLELDCELASQGINVESGEHYADPRRDELEAGALDWRLLLQLSADDDLGASFGEGFGRLSFLIRNQDLAAQSFDRVWMIRR